MIDLSNYEIIENEQNKNSVELSQLICISALNESYIDSRVVSFTENTITIEGKYTILDEYAVVKGEIVYISDYTIDNDNTILDVIRNQKNTKAGDIQVKDTFRTITIFNETEDYNYSESIGNLSNVFDISLNTGQLVLDSDIKYWDINNINYKYLWKPKKNYIYYFKGIKNELILKHTTLLKSVRANSFKNSVKIEFRDKMYLYWDSDLRSTRVVRNNTPKEFLSGILNIDEEYIKYANNLTFDDYSLIRNVELSKYKKISDILTAYVKSGIRLCFNRFEYLVIYSDKYIENLAVNKTINGSMIETTSSVSSERLVFNKINSTYSEYDTYQDFNALDNKYVKYSYNYSVNSFILLTDDYFNSLSINDSTFLKQSSLGEKIVLKENISGIEIQGIIVKKTNLSATLVFVNQSKDSILDYLGRIDYLNSLGFNTSKDFILYYGRDELPIIFKDIRTFSTGERSEYMKKVILPKVLNVSDEVIKENKRIINATFGSASNLQDGVTYTGYFEEIDGIYGTFDNTNLLYNRELEQYNGINVPISVMSNTITTPKGNVNSNISYDTFDNRDISVKIYQTENSDSNAIINISNNKEIYETELFESTYVSKLTNSYLKINPAELNQYNVGDVLVVKKPETFQNVNDRALYYNVLSTIKWTILSVLESSGDYYILLDSDFPDDYTWIRYPSTSIIYLQSFYIRGNPVLKYDNTIQYVLSQDSIDLYETQSIDLNSDFLDIEDFRKFISYYTNFIGINNSNTKTIKTLNVWGYMDLEMFDIIDIYDPYILGENKETKYVILSIKTNNLKAGNIQEIQIMNLNPQSVEEVELDIYENIEYAPLNVPVGYSTSGNEGDIIKEQESTTDLIVDARDEELGNIGLSLIDPSVFYGIINNVTDDIITFNSTFYGTSNLIYKQTFFNLEGSEEFVIKIEDELIYCNSIANTNGTTYKANILKRGFIDNNKYNGLFDNKQVKFYEIVNQLNNEDGYISRKALIGDQFNYLKFDKINGLDIKALGNVKIENPYNRYFMDKEGLTSQLLIEVPESNWGNLDSDIKFQIGGGSGLASRNYIKYTKDIGLDISGVINLNDDDSYISFNNGITLKSIPVFYGTGFEFKDNENGMSFNTTNYPDDTLDFQLTNNKKKLNIYSSNPRGLEGGGYISFEWKNISDVYQIEPLEIKGMTIGQETSNPKNGSIRLNTNLVQVYYNSTWQTIFTLA